MARAVGLTWLASFIYCKDHREMFCLARAVVRIGCRACRPAPIVEMPRKLKLILLSVVLLVGLAFGIRCLMPTKNQLTARAYVGCVRVYQAVGRPLLKGTVACRYRPTCSDYSITAVQRYGTLRGLVLTYRRIRSCTNKVPMGTLDPVPG